MTTRISENNQTENRVCINARNLHLHSQQIQTCRKNTRKAQSDEMFRSESTQKRNLFHKL